MSIRLFNNSGGYIDLNAGGDRTAANTFTLPAEKGTLLRSASSLDATTLTGNVAASRIITALNATGSAPFYACRAWCVFTGTGTVSLTGNGNVSSITDLNTGSYQVNFATALSDANYAGLATCGGANANDSRTLNGTVQARTTANCVITTVAYNVGNDGFDCDRVYFAAFR